MKKFLLLGLLLCGCGSPSVPAPLTASDKPTTPVTLAPFRKLDGLSKEEIYTMRTSAVAAHPDLAALFRPGYKPDEAIFGQIESGKPWWGLEGLAYYGPGPNASKGNSRESFFIGNPYALIGLGERNAYDATESKASYPAQEIFPKASKLEWARDGSYGWLTYNDMDEYFTADNMYHAEAPGYKPHQLDLHGYNSRDLGYPFFTIDEGLSHNVVWARPASGSAPIIQFMHCGGSCGRPGGCNNKSPYDKNMEIEIKETPARIYLKLWREAPTHPEKDPERWFVIDVKG